VYAASGVMRVGTARGTWVVPPNRALLVPAGVEHEIRTIGAVAMRTLYFNVRSLQKIWEGNDCTVVAVPPPLRELIIALIETQRSGANLKREAHLIALILEELRSLRTQPLYIPMPKNSRLANVCEAIQSDPGSALTLAEWGSRFGISAKTLTRDFLSELGMTFGRWRQQIRLLTALERLAAGEQVIVVAMDLGYKSPSSFAAMFRKMLGSAPSRYFE
jgi:AraC-like DNA-binding protein